MRNERTPATRMFWPIAALLVLAMGALCVARAQEAAQGETPAGSSLRVKVVDGKGQPVETTQFTLWKAVDPNEPLEGPASSPWMIRHWQDPQSGVTWQPQLHTGANGTYSANQGIAAKGNGTYATVKGIAGGRYFVTAEAASGTPARDGTPYGVSEPVEVDGVKEATITVKLEGRSPLVVRTTDAQTARPVSTDIVLTRSDGLPIGLGIYGWLSGTDDKGILRYSALKQGSYTVRAKAEAYRYGGNDYPEVVRTVTVDGSPSEVTVDMQLTPVAPSQQEVERRWPFVVEGTVTGADGKPVEGVEISVDGGWGTLMPCGSTRTGNDGKYYMRFAPSWHGRDGYGEVLEVIPPQAAVIGAHKSGMYEANLCRQGDLIMASKEEDARNFGWTKPLLLPNRSYTLDFVMVPAATVKGRIVDAEGKPFTARIIYAHAKDLYPASSVMGGWTQDAEGRFEGRDMPLESLRFSVVPQGNDEFSADKELNLTKPGEYEVQLMYDKAAGTVKMSAVKEP